MRSRLTLILAALLLTLSISAVALAQSSDPNRPVAHPTATEENGGDGDFQDRTPTSNDDEDTPADEEEGSSGSAPIASPEGSPIPVEGGDDLAAMVLDITSMPDGWYLSGESYVSVDELADGLV